MKLKLLVLAAFSAAAVFANNIILAATQLPNVLENGNYGSTGATYNGFIGATINGIPNQLILCDDYAHETQVPSGNMIYDFSTGLQLQTVRFTGGSMVQNYDEASVLVWELFKYVSANGSSASAHVVTDYQYAVWNIFDPYNATSNPNGVKLNSNQQTLQTSALNLVNTQGAMLTADVYPNVWIYTPDPKGGSTSNQEFLQFNVASPEPGSFLLIAGALLMGGALAARNHRRKVRSAAASAKEALLS